MTIQTGYQSEQFVITPTKVYDFTFVFVDLDDIKVLEENADGGLVVVDPANYTATTTTSPPLHSGGTITIDAGYTHPASAVSLRIARDTDIDQQIDYQVYDAFPSETHEFGLDKLTMIIQELEGKLFVLGGDGDPVDPTDPVAGLYVPLVGTSSELPITGNLEWDAPAASGKYRLRHNYSSSHGNLFGIMTDDDDSIMLSRQTTVRLMEEQPVGSSSTQMEAFISPPQALLTTGR